MRILILGGTQFVGRHLAAAALEKGHRVTLFNRGQTNTGLFPRVERLIGDRDGNLRALRGHHWDAVVDVSGYVPRLVRDSAALLRGAVGRYVFISTGSVYDFSQFQAYAGEEAPLQVLEDKTTEEHHGEAYGGLKALCEGVVREYFPEQELILRLGVVAGPYDPSDRVTYWVTRAARGGGMLAPGSAERPIQFIDARDMAAFAMAAIEKSLTGTFNLAGNIITWAHFLDACRQAGRNPDLRLTWIDDFDFLQEQTRLGDFPMQQAGRPYDAFPLALPAEMAHIWTMNSNQALDEGLIYRSTLNTARDILSWAAHREEVSNEPLHAGMTPELEQRLLAEWERKKEA